jgi:hypothetical protein
MPRTKKLELGFPVKLTLAQRKILAEVAPSLGNRLKLDEPNQRIIDFTVAELKAIKAKAGTAIQKASTGYERRPLRLVLRTTDQAIAQSQRLSATGSLFQLKITLRESHPPIWRRIHAKDCTLDKLHEHIQTAMGWTNSHLHDFRIEEQRYGDPELLQENFNDMGYEDSTTTMLSDVVPKTGERLRFEYEYDFGDCWSHEILFEGRVRADAGGRYPVCLEGARACPPEDVGGTGGYTDFLEAIADPDHERHDELLNWVGGKFDAEAFDPAAATKRMKKGLPDWRRMR